MYGFGLRLGQALDLGPELVAQHSHEITALPALLSALQGSRCLVPIDAMRTQRAIARQIVDQGGDYVLALKRNPATLYEDVRPFFEAAQAKQFQGIAHAYVVHTDGGPGRIEVRRCWAVSEVQWLRDQDRWVGLRSLAMAAERLAQAVRGRWGMEHQVHWVLDVAFGEDRSRIRKHDGAANMVLLRRLRLNLIRQEHRVKSSLKGRRKRADGGNRYIEKVLGL